MSVITTTYRQKQLKMLREDPDQVNLWNKHPVKLSKIEEGTFNLDRVISILANESQSPSQLAGIQPDQITSPLIHRINRAYTDAIEAYKKKLDEAKRKDLESIETNKNFWIYENYPGFAWTIKIFGASFISWDQYERDARAYRFAWLVEVSVLEERRLTIMKNQIEGDLDPFIEDLEDLAEQNQIDTSLLRQVRQLKDIYRAHFPGVPLVQEEALANLAQRLPAELAIL